VLQERDLEIERGEWQGAAEIVVVQFPPDALSELTHGEAGPLNLQTQMPTEDETISSLITAMRDELRRDCSSGRMFAQGLSLALAGYVRSRYGVPVPERRTPGRFSPREMTQIVEYTMQNLSRDIGIDDLASLLNLSNSQFSRLFKKTVGTSPYQYLQKKRIERAVDLMRGPESLAQIAHEVGFSSQSHFTEVFRAITGVTPMALRSSL